MTTDAHLPAYSPRRSGTGRWWGSGIGTVLAVVWVIRALASCGEPGPNPLVPLSSPAVVEALGATSVSPYHDPLTEYVNAAEEFTQHIALEQVGALAAVVDAVAEYVQVVYTDQQQGDRAADLWERALNGEAAWESVGAAVDAYYSATEPQDGLEKLLEAQRRVPTWSLVGDEDAARVALQARSDARFKLDDIELAEYRRIEDRFDALEEKTPG